HFAAGDYLTRYPEGHNYEIQIDSPFEKPGWTVRRFSSTGESIFPGSAIEFEGSYYEIFSQEYKTDPPVMVSYHLKKWDNRFPIRVKFHYNEQECRNTALAYRNRLKRNRAGLLLTLFSPIVGMLPAEDQTRIANQHGMKATQMTFFSALCLLPPAGFFILRCAMYIFDRVPFPGPDWIHWIYPSGFYLFAESLLRMVTANKLEEPTGSLILSLPVYGWRSIQKIVSPGSRKKVPEILQVPQSHSGSKLDRIHPLPDGEHVEIISILPKPHWNSRVGIGWDGAWYGVVETGKLTLGKEVRHRFLLKRVPEGTWFASVIDYSPDEVEVLFRNKLRLDLKTWVDTFAFFWGFLSREDQTRLEELYDFDSLKFTRLTIFVIAILSAANLLVSIINIVAGVGRALDVWLILPAGYLLLESYSRRQDWKRGE
ncbi:MAG: hypothetical protein ACRD4B_11085, partial [Acidobacteriota bacterium]